MPPQPRPAYRDCSLFLLVIVLKYLPITLNSMHYPLIAPHSAGDAEGFGPLTTNPFPPLSLKCQRIVLLFVLLLLFLASLLLNCNFNTLPLYLQFQLLLTHFLFCKMRVFISGHFLLLFFSLSPLFKSSQPPHLLSVVHLLVPINVMQLTLSCSNCKSSISVLQRPDQELLRREPRLISTSDFLCSPEEASQFLVAIHYSLQTIAPVENPLIFFHHLIRDPLSLTA